MGKAAKKSGRMLLYPSFFSPLQPVPPKKAFFTSFTAAHLPTRPFSHFPLFRLLSVSSTFPPPSSSPSPPSRCMGIMRRQASPPFLWRPLLFPRSCQKGKEGEGFFFRARHPSSPLLEPREVVSAEKGGGGGGARMVVGALTYVRCTTVCSTSVEPPPLSLLVTTAPSVRAPYRNLKERTLALQKTGRGNT